MITHNRYLEKIADSLFVLRDPEAKEIHKKLMRSHDISMGTMAGGMTGNILGNFLKTRKARIGAIVGSTLGGLEGGRLYNSFVRQKQRE